MQHDLTGPATSRPDDASRSTEDIKSATHDAAAAVKSALDGTADQIKQAASQARSQGADKINTGSDGAAASLRQVSDQLKAAAAGLEGQQPWAEKAFQSGADGLDRVSDYLASGKFDDFARDIQTFARSNPAAFLAGSVALGFLVARVGKTAVHHATATPAPVPPEPPVASDRDAMANAFGAQATEVI